VAWIGLLDDLEWGGFNEFLSAKCRLKALAFKLVAMATDQHLRVCCNELLLFTRKSKEERKTPGEVLL